MHLMTIWQADTEQGHEVRILHRDMPVDGPADAMEKSDHVASAVLRADGTLICTVAGREPFAVAPDDVEIDEYRRPFPHRGKPFIPDVTTAEGRRRIALTMTDARYVGAPDDYVPVTIGLAGLALLPGAIGPLASVAYDLR